jgi:hypothetical protein
MPGSRQLLSLAAVSGLFSYLLLWLAGNVPAWLPLPADVFRYAPGFVFGLMALQLAAQAPLRRAGLVLAAGLTWVLMFQLASGLVTEQEQSTVLACGVAGGLGAWLMSLAVRLLAPRRLSLLAMLMAFVAGTLGGALIGQGLMEPDDSWLLEILLIAGFITWQAGVSGSLLLVDELGEHEAHA